MLVIQVPDKNDSIGRITLNGKEYYIRFTINSSYDYWSFGLYDLRKNPIIPMTKVVPLVPLLHYYKYSDLPDGVFMCVPISGNVGRKSFSENKAYFVFVPGDELDEGGYPWRIG